MPVIQSQPSVKVYHKHQSELLKQYMMGEFETGVSKKRQNNNKRYYEEHLRAMEQQKQLELGDEQEERELKRKMLFMAEQMQYQDDFDDQNLYGERNRNREGQRPKNRAQGADSSSDDDEAQEEAKQKENEKLSS